MLGAHHRRLRRGRSRRGRYHRRHRRSDVGGVHARGAGQGARLVGKVAGPQHRLHRRRSAGRRRARRGSGHALAAGLHLGHHRRPQGNRVRPRPHGLLPQIAGVLRLPTRRRHLHRAVADPRQRTDRHDDASHLGRRRSRGAVPVVHQDPPVGRLHRPRRHHLVEPRRDRHRHLQRAELAEGPGPPGAAGGQRRDAPGDLAGLRGALRHQGPRVVRDDGGGIRLQPRRRRAGWFLR